MAKGSVGVNTGTVIHVKKAEPIECDCNRCRWSKECGSTLYCSFYDIISPKKKKCRRYWCVKPTPKKDNKKKSKHKKSKRSKKVNKDRSVN